MQDVDGADVVAVRKALQAFKGFGPPNSRAQDREARDAAIAALNRLAAQMESLERELQSTGHALANADRKLQEAERERDELRSLCSGYTSDVDAYADELYKAGWSDPATGEVRNQGWKPRADAAEAREAALGQERELLIVTIDGLNSQVAGLREALEWIKANEAGEPHAAHIAIDALAADGERE